MDTTNLISMENVLRTEGNLRVYSINVSNYLLLKSNLAVKLGKPIILLNNNSHRVNRVTLPLRNAPKKWMLFSIAMVGSSK